MHEQDFERSVQQKMEELSFTPSLPVWEKVEQELRVDKKRRTAFWLLPFTAIGLAAAIWFLPVDAIINKGPKPVPAHAPQNGTPGSTNNSVKANKQTAAPGERAGWKNENTYSTTKEQATKPLLVQAKTKTPFNIQQDATTQVLAAEPAAMPEVHDMEISQADLIASHQVPVPLLPTTAHHDLQKLQGSKPLFNAAPFRPLKPSSKRLRWNFDLQYGRTYVFSTGLFDAAPANVISDPLQNGGFPTSGFGIRPRLQTAPGAYLSAGAQLRRNLGRRFAFETGIRYSLYSQRVSVGEKLSSRSTFGNISMDARESESLYRAGTSAFFKSRFHQFSVPFSLQWKPFYNLPLETEGGLAMGYLAGGKTLQYDTSSRLFYEAKPGMQRFQLQGHAALNYPILKSKQWQWLAGPRLQYHFSSLYPNGNAAAKLSSLSIGLQARRR